VLRNGSREGRSFGLFSLDLHRFLLSSEISLVGDAIFTLRDAANSSRPIYVYNTVDLFSSQTRIASVVVRCLQLLNIDLDDSL